MKHGASDNRQTTARRAPDNPAWFAFWSEAFRLHAVLLERRAAKRQSQGEQMQGDTRR